MLYCCCHTLLPLSCYFATSCHTALPLMLLLSHCPTALPLKLPVSLMLLYYCHAARFCYATSLLSCYTPDVIALCHCHIALLLSGYLAAFMIFSFGGTPTKSRRPLAVSELPVAKHFNGDGHTLADMTAVAMDQIHSHNQCLRKVRESRWIRTLGTWHPSGMNLRVDSR